MNDSPNNVGKTLELFKKYNSAYANLVYNYSRFLDNEDEQKDYNKYINSFYSITDDNQFIISYTDTFMFWITTESVCKCAKLFMLIIPCFMFYRCNLYLQSNSIELYNFYGEFHNTIKTIVEISMNIKYNTFVNMDINKSKCDIYSTYIKQLFGNIKRMEIIANKYKEQKDKEELDFLKEKYSI